MSAKTIFVKILASCLGFGFAGQAVHRNHVFINSFTAYNIHRYDGPDVTPFIHMLMCVKPRELV